MNPHPLGKASGALTGIAAKGASVNFQSKQLIGVAHKVHNLHVQKLAVNMVEKAVNWSGREAIFFLSPFRIAC